MNHTIVGSGLIGSYIGCVLSDNDQSVTMIASGQWAERLSAPVILTDYENNQRECHPGKVVSREAVMSEKDAPAPFPDVIWLTVKCTAVEGAVNTLEKLVGPETLILCCQNGVGSHAPVSEAFPDHTVLRVMVPFNVIWQDPQNLHRGSEGTVVIEAHEKSQSVINCVRHAMLPAVLSEHIEAVQWAKLQLNLGNGVNALADLPVKAMLSSRGYRKVIAALMSELLVVCDAANRTLPKVARMPGHWIPHLLRLPDWLFSRLASQMLAIDPKVKTSMWWDLHDGKKTEQDFLYGAVVREGRRLGISCPANSAIQTLLKKAEEERQSTGHYTALTAEQILSHF